VPRYSLVYVVRGSAATSSLSPERFVDRDDVGSASKQGRRRDPRPGAAFEHPLPRERFERVEDCLGVLRPSGRVLRGDGVERCHSFSRR
jgi:hypothetical protein